MKIIGKKKKPWEGAQVVELRVQLSCQFMMLCSLLDLEPERIIRDFLTTLGAESYGKQGDAQQLLVDYFVDSGYGQPSYSKGDIRRILEELKALGTLWPDGEERKVVDKHVAWQRVYHKYWYRKWYYKLRKKHPPQQREAPKGRIP